MMVLGPLRPAGETLQATDWPVIHAFGAATGRLSEPWEYEALADMCRAYAAAFREGADPLCIPPVEREAVQ
jgi:hypothetical protein